MDSVEDSPQTKTANKRLVCPECGKQFVQRFNRQTCSTRCAISRQQKQLAQLSERRKAEREAKRSEKGTRACEICGTYFHPVAGNQKYCSHVCAAAGLQVAIERQRERRQAARKGRAEERGEVA